MKKCLLVFILSMLTLSCFAQKLLVINKIGSPKTTRILPGQRMTIKLSTESTKYRGELEFILEDSIIHDGQKIAIKDIERIIIKNSWIASQSPKLIIAGIGYPLIVGMNTGTFSFEKSKGMQNIYLTAGILVASGALLYKLGIKSYKINAKRTVKIVNFDFSKPPITQ